VTDGRAGPGSAAAHPVVIDAHLHLWDTAQLSYPWLQHAAGLPRRFRLADLDVGSVPVDSVVVVEANCDPGQARDEVTWVVGHRASAIRLAAVVAGVRLDSAAAAADVVHYERIEKVKGVRQVVQDDPASHLLAPAFVAGVRELAGPGLTFDLCVRSHQLRAAAALAEQVPEVTFVLDHLGKPLIGPRPEPAWLADLRHLAARSNVQAKLSGLSSEAVGATAGSTARGLFRPYLQHALDVFGPSRCMFGSDWPVAGATSHYEEWFDHVLDAAGPLGADELADVLSGTATRTYRLQGAARGAERR
jgi:L-fuconolactonase